MPVHGSPIQLPMITRSSTTSVSTAQGSTPPPTGSATRKIEERTKLCLSEAEPAFDTLISLVPHYLPKSTYAEDLLKIRHAMRNEMFKEPLTRDEIKSCLAAHQY